VTIINIRGTSGSGKSTLVRRFLDEHPHTEIKSILGDWKKEKVVAYKVHNGVYKYPVYVIGRYTTQCGGCDTMSYKGSHEDIESMVREAALKGNVIYEGLTISSTITRWLRISEDNPGEFVWAFMNTPEEECYKRILARSGREPKRDAKGRADYNRKHHGCEIQKAKLEALNENVIELSSDDLGYERLLNALT
jgi:GTPase SAR1 family protein